MTAARVLILAVTALALCSCNLSKKTPVAAAAPEADEASLFEVSQKQLPQLKIVEVRKTSWSSTVRTTGTVDWDADHTTQAITQVNGPISRLLVDLGTRVDVKQQLLYVSSPDVAGAISTYKKATNRLEYSKRTLDRSKDLLDHKVIAMKDLETAEQDYNDAGAEVQNDLQALKIFGVTQQEIDDAQHQGVAINPQLAVRSPIAGIIVQKLVTPGLVIQAGMTACFTISDNSTVWVQGHIYDRDLEAVRVGDAVDGDGFLLSPHVPRSRFVYRSAYRSRHPDYFGPYRDEESGWPAQKRHVRRRGDSHALRKDPPGGAHFGHPSQRRESALRLRGGPAGKIRPASGNPRCRAG